MLSDQGCVRFSPLAISPRVRQGILQRAPDITGMPGALSLGAHPTLRVERTSDRSQDELSSSLAQTKSGLK